MLRGGLPKNGNRDLRNTGSPVFNGKVPPAVALLAGGSATAAITGGISRQFQKSLLYQIRLM
jgi:hypothetical protein